MHRRAWKRTVHRALALGALGGIIGTSACGGASGGGGAAGPAKAADLPAGSTASAPKPEQSPLAEAKVFDPSGKPAKCGVPRGDCPDVAPDRAFLDHCRLAGFQVRQCGCEVRCSGDVVAARRHYDAAGNPKDCAPAGAECSPPQASAAFQDACVEKGHRLDVCGCEWLCSGNFLK